MKVLFAVSDENISKNIIKRYQSIYKEIISWKNVYFFDAIVKEIQMNGFYDRIVISEDLEPSSNDNILFDKLDNISDECSNNIKKSIPIIVISSDKREKGSSWFVKLFGIGIYNALIGADRKIDVVCKLINNPRVKKDAKDYYKIEVEEIEYHEMDSDSVSELEIQNILGHYKKLGKNEEGYIQSFNEIANQYTDVQLKLITKFLPLNVRAVLEERCPKYQEVMIGSVKEQIKAYNNKKAYSSTNLKSRNENNIGLIDKELERSKLTKPVVIPSTVDVQKVKKTYQKNDPKKVETKKIEPLNDVNRTVSASKQRLEAMKKLANEKGQISNLTSLEYLNDEMQTNGSMNLNGVSTINDIPAKMSTTEEVVAPKRGRGRPRKKAVSTEETIKPEIAVTEKKGRGRPKKIVEDQEIQEDKMDEDILASNFDYQEENVLPGFEEENTLPGFEEENTLPGFEEENTLPGFEEENILPGFEEDDFDDNDLNSISKTEENNRTINDNNYYSKNTTLNNVQNKELRQIDVETSEKISNLITGNKKIVAFVGTSKNGTSFLVNNLAVNLSQKGIKTAILDLTKNKNAYYIYTQNDDGLREKSFRCIQNLRNGIADGIDVNKNLTVYTTVPEEDSSFNDFGNILETLVNNYSLILLDCDFDTNLNYFANSQEIYLVQTYDILTIQPLTAFLNEMKYKNILDQNKLRIIINKTLKLRKLTNEMIIGGISCYNDPASTYINTLFNKDVVRYTTIPFEDQTYARYLERIVDCEISLKGYSKIFLDALENLSNMVYPLIANNNHGKIKNYNNYEKNKDYNNYEKNKNTKTYFNNNMDATLDKMRKNI